MREIIDDGIDGELIEPLNCDELTRRISTLLQDQTRARRLGARGRAKVALRFTWEEAASQIEKVYYELLH
jgi:glycosyltransferase involved in cell wall biosynthesis